MRSPPVTQALPYLSNVLIGTTVGLSYVCSTAVRESASLGLIRRHMCGSGLGLAIVRHVLQRHGAELAITSEEGRGSTFHCHFPVTRLIRTSVAKP